MRRLRTKIISPFLQVFVKHYFKKPLHYAYKSVNGTVLPGVFFPHFTMSTRFFIDFLEDRDLMKKKVLELGCGTGIISVYAAQRGAIVTSSDINPAAIENTKLNAERNAVSLKIIFSDLFENIEPQYFDYILINPPYYPKKPINDAEKAWFCGTEFEYFQALFPKLTAYFRPTSAVFMILSEDCDLARIKSIAAGSNLRFTAVFERKKWGEMTSIYGIERVLV